MKLAAHLQPASRDAGRGSSGSEGKLKRRLLYIFRRADDGAAF